MHKAKAVIISCMDFRFHKTLQHWLEENGYLGHIDEITIAGASRDIATPLEQSHHDVLMRQIGLSIKLHDPDEIIICDHQDCGGYKDIIVDGTPADKDFDMHKKFLGEAEEILKEKYPNKKFRKLYITMDQEVREVE